MDGYDVYDTIKEIPELREIPVVAVSAADPNGEIPKAEEKGADDYISKPINRYQFPEQLGAISNGKSIWK
ncbi:MAG: response regulator [Chloroflexi bacterium]|nr:response regulator [Chloroflexota bacterium]